MDRFIFLDINGVLDIGQGLDSELVDRFAQLVKDTDATVVLSSTWRRCSDTFKIIRKALREREVLLRWTTPYCPMDQINEEGALYHESRPAGDIQRTHEILRWLQHREITAWVAIDDEDLRLDEANRVRTNEYVGLTVEKADEAKAKLFCLT